MITKADIRPISREPVAEKIAQQLLGLIQSGNLKAGQQLPPERELAHALGVSRASLREAVRALSLLGVLNTERGGGVTVSALDPESLLGPLHFYISLNERNIDALFEARVMIESGVAALAATRMTEEAIDRLRSCVRVDEQALSDPNRFIEADVEFHWTIFETAGNPLLERVAKSLQVLGRASRAITAHIPGVLERSITDHELIIDALVRGDADAAALAMTQHLRNVHSAYRQARVPEDSC